MKFLKGIAIFLCFNSFLPAEDLPAYRIHETDTLSIYARRTEDIVFLTEILSYVQKETQRVLPKIPLNTHTSIRLVYHEVSPARPYVLDLSNPRDVKLDVSWGKHTTLSDVITAYLSLQVTHWQQRSGFPIESLPLWLEQGIVENVAIKLRQTSWHHLPDDKVSTQFQDLPTVFSAQVNKINATFFLRWIDKNLGERQSFFFRAILQGRDPLMSLWRAFPERPKSVEELETLWRLGFYDELQFRDTAYWTLEESLDRLHALKQWFIKVDEQIVNLSLSELWQYRAEPVIWEARKKQLSLIKVYLTKINPAYYNAMLSLGRSLEVLEEKKETRFVNAVAQHEKDWEAAILLHQEVRRIIPLAPVP